MDIIKILEVDDNILHAYGDYGHPTNDILVKASYNKKATSVITMNLVKKNQLIHMSEVFTTFSYSSRDELWNY